MTWPVAWPPEATEILIFPDLEVTDAVGGAQVLAFTADLAGRGRFGLFR
jgi:hypothetical protein